MKINLSPQRRDEVITVTKVGDALVINGDVLDFAPLLNGSTLPAEAIDNPWIIGDVHRVDGQIELTMILPHAADASYEARFPVPLILNSNGPVELPA